MPPPSPHALLVCPPFQPPRDLCPLVTELLVQCGQLLVLLLGPLVLADERVHLVPPTLRALLARAARHVLCHRTPAVSHLGLPTGQELVLLPRERARLRGRAGQRQGAGGGGGGSTASRVSSCLLAAPHTAAAVARAGKGHSGDHCDLATDKQRGTAGLDVPAPPSHAPRRAAAHLGRPLALLDIGTARRGSRGAGRLAARHPASARAKEGRG